MKKIFGIVTQNGKFISKNDINFGLKESRAIIDPFINFYGVNGLIEPPYNPETLANILDMNTYHFRCCRTKALDAAGYGWTLLTEDSEQYNSAKKIIDNFSQPLTSILVSLMLDYEAIGYCTLEFIRENYDLDNPVVDIFHIPSYTIRIHRDENKYCQIRGGKRRWFKKIGYEKDIDYDTGNEYEKGILPAEKRASELLFITNYHPRSEYYGLPDIIPALGAVYADQSIRNYNVSFFESYGVPAYAIFITGNFDAGEINEETGKTELEEAIEEHFKNLSKSPHSTLILSLPSSTPDNKIEVTFEKLAVDTKDLSFKEYRQDCKYEIFTAHGVPPYRAGIIDQGSLGGTTAEESTEIYKMSVIEPRQSMIENMINKYLMPAIGYPDVEFKLQDIDTTDEVHTLDIVTRLFEYGAISPNQIIKLFAHKYNLTELDAPAMNSRYLQGQPIKEGDEASTIGGFGGEMPQEKFSMSEFTNQPIENVIGEEEENLLERIKKQPLKTEEELIERIKKQPLEKKE